MKTKQMTSKKTWKKDSETWKAEQEAKVDSALSTVVDLFKTGNLPEKVALLTFPQGNKPFDNWSFRNQLIAMIMGNTTDARTFNAWKRLGRFPQKGSKAVYILKPVHVFVKKEKEVEENGETVKKEEKRKVLVGFKPHAVFPYEVTTGKPLPEEAALELPTLPLMDKAEEWGIPVTAVGFNGRAYGSHLTNRNTGEVQIRLASPEESIFLHEIAHEADRRANTKDGKLKGGQDPAQEITAELTAAVLGQIVGVQGKNTLGNHYEYIQAYAKQLRADGDVTKACLQVLSRVERCLRLLLDLTPEDDSKE